MSKIVGNTVIFGQGEGDLASLLNILILISNNTHLKVNKEIYKEMRKEHSLEGVSKKKKYKFFKSIVMAEKPSRGFNLMAQSGLLKYLMPELQEGVGCMQNIEYHQDDTFTHCVKSCDAAEKIFEIRAAALLHDIGKPFVKTSETVLRCPKCGEEYQHIGRTFPCSCGHLVAPVEVRQKFYKHEVKSDTLAKAILQRFCVPKKLGLFIASLVRNHMYSYSSDWTDAALRRFIARTNMKREHIKNIECFPLFLVREADRKSRGLPGRTRKQNDFEKRLKELFNERIGKA